MNYFGFLEACRPNTFRTAFMSAPGENGLSTNSKLASGSACPEIRMIETAAWSVISISPPKLVLAFAWLLPHASFVQASCADGPSLPVLQADSLVVSCRRSLREMKLVQC